MRAGSYKRSDAVMFEITGGLAVLLTEHGDELVTLNPLGTLIWMELERPTDPGDLVDIVGQRFERVPRDVVEHDIHTFIEELATSGLIVGDADG